MTTIRTPAWRLIDTNGDRDLYDLSTFRYEVADIATGNPSVVSTLSASLGVQGSRPGITYTTWAAGNPRLTDPEEDGDGDGVSNKTEYATGSDPLDSADRPQTSFEFIHLGSIGLGTREAIFSCNLRTDRNDFSMLPSTSTDLMDWSSDTLDLLDATRLDDSMYRFRFRVTGEPSPSRFLRLEASP